MNGLENQQLQEALHPPLCESEPQINSRERQQRNEGLYAFQSAVNSMQACKKAGPLNI